MKSPLSKSRKLEALLTSALAIPGIASIKPARAQNIAEFPIVRFQYAYYRDYQDNGDRMEVQAPMVELRSPLGSTTEIEAGIAVDTMSGASPLYLDTLSGASGIGVDDERWVEDVKITQYFDSFSVGAGVVYSSEDDYDSLGGLVEVRVWTPDKNTVVTGGISGNSDRISSTNDSSLHETRDTGNLLVGVTQIIDARSLVQSNLTYTSSQGYHSDPYKTFDNRPRSRDHIASLTRYVLAFPTLDSSLHTDYRFSFDSWNVKSHMVEVAYYQTLGENWIVRPNFRYYTQSAADFFPGTFPPPEQDSFFSADQRLSAFGSLTFGGMVSRNLGAGLSADVSYSFMQQRDNLRPGGGTKGIEPFFAHIAVLGFTKQFK